MWALSGFFASQILNDSSVSGPSVKDALETLASGVGPCSTIDGVSNPGGDIDLVAGINVTITPDNVGKKITFNATNPSIVSVDGVSNPGGNIDLVEGANITITPDNVLKKITIDAAGGGGGKQIVTVGTAGADYNNFDAAIDYLRSLGGGTIITNMTITSTAIKDVSNIEFVGIKTAANSLRINKTATSGYWYGSNVKFSQLYFWRLADPAGGNEIFRFTTAFSYAHFEDVSCIGLSTSPPVINCGSLEVYLSLDSTVFGVKGGLNYSPVSNILDAVFYLIKKSYLYAKTQIDYLDMDNSCSYDADGGLVSPASIFTILLKSSTNVDAKNGTIYYSTTNTKLVYKDSGGVVHDLY